MLDKVGVLSVKQTMALYNKNLLHGLLPVSLI